VRPADGLQGQLGLYEVTFDGVTSYMSRQEVEALEASLEPTSPVGSDPTQQGGSDASRSPGLLVEKGPWQQPTACASAAARHADNAVSERRQRAAACTLIARRSATKNGHDEARWPADRRRESGASLHCRRCASCRGSRPSSISSSTSSTRVAADHHRLIAARHSSCFSPAV
jgi:hypothetical protein